MLHSSALTCTNLSFHYQFSEALPNAVPAQVAQLFREASPEAIDFLNLTLQFDPDKRVEVGGPSKHLNPSM
jgi:hypothetical protein